MSELKTKAIAKKLSILTQNPTTPEGLTVRDLVAQGRYPYQNWWQQWSAQDEKIVEEALLWTQMKELIALKNEPLSWYFMI
jgi:iron complex transport system ATP-binding protein